MSRPAGHSLSRDQSGPDLDRAVRGALVCAGLYRRHHRRLVLCARHHRVGAAVGRPGADHRARLRRFRHLDHARHHPRRPHRLRAVLQSSAVRRASAADFRTVERRHVVSRRRRRLRRRHRAVCAGSAACRCCRSATSPPRVAPIGLFLGRLANFINGELWGRPTDVPWAMVFPNGGPIPRHPSQLYEAALEGVVLFIVLGVLVRVGALKRPGLVTGAFCARLRHRAHRLANSSASPTRSSAFSGAAMADHGNAAVHSADPGRHRHSRFRVARANR